MSKKTSIFSAEAIGIGNHEIFVPPRPAVLRTKDNQTLTLRQVLTFLQKVADKNPDSLDMTITTAPDGALEDATRVEVDFENQIVVFS